jgi:integrase
MTLYKRPDSDVWWYEFQVAGNRYRGSTKTANKREATAIEVERRREAVEDLSRARLGIKRFTLWEVAQKWLASSEHALKDHKNNVSRVRKLFGIEMVQEGKGNWVEVEGKRYGLSKTLYVHEVTQDTLMTLRDTRVREGNSPATINREMSLMQSLMGYAADMRCVMPAVPIVWSQKRNRAASLKMREPGGKLRWLTVPEEKAVLAKLAEAIHEGDCAGQDNYDLSVLLLDTGARYSEIAELKWSQVDLDAGRIYLYRPKVDNEGGLDLTARSLEILKRRREATRPRSFVFPGMRPAGRGRQVWVDVDVCRGHATDGIQQAIDAAGLNADLSRGKATPHTFRDTFASRLVQAGLSLLKVSHLLGHADESMTRKYAHLCPENTGREARDLLNRLHASNSTQGDDPIAVALG